VRAEVVVEERYDDRQYDEISYEQDEHEEIPVESRQTTTNENKRLKGMRR